MLPFDQYDADLAEMKDLVHERLELLERAYERDKEAGVHDELFLDIAAHLGYEEGLKSEPHTQVR